MNEIKGDLVSIIIPVYNVLDYLEECILSVINQTYTNLEIIVVDDGSNDGSEVLCDKYAQMDSRIVVIHQNNEGLSSARNAGIDRAGGQYITFLDSDDYVDCDYIEYLYGLLVNNSADISLCQNRNISGKESTLNKGICTGETVIKGKDKCISEFFTNSKINSAAWAKLYNISLFDSVRYPKGKYHEDVFTTHILIGNCDCLVIGNETKYNYRIRNNSISNSFFEIRHMDIIEGKMKQYDFVNNNYPHCKQYAQADIVYASNYIVMKMIDSAYYDDEIIRYLQSLYRKNEIAFLRGVSSIKAKFFSVLAYMNLRTIIVIYEKVNLVSGKRK